MKGRSHRQLCAGASSVLAGSDVIGVVIDSLPVD